MLRSIAWHGMRAVEFSKGDYAALLVPDMGANLVRLADTRRGIEILRAPAGDEVEEFRRRPHVFGLPILFPPNRIADGQYTFDGRTYRFPITDAKGGHYHHGILKSQPFAVSKAWETADEVLVECRYYSNAGNDAIFRDFPHEFKCKIVYRLTARGLEQEVMFANRSKEPMPVGVGFHTPMRIPFAGGAAGDYVMRAAVGERVELSERNIPTGRKLPLSEKFARLRGAGLHVEYARFLYYFLHPFDKFRHCSIHAVRQDHITTILYLLGCIFYAGRKPYCLQRSYIVKKISDKRGFLCSSSKIPAGTSECIPLSGCFVHNLHQRIFRMLDSDAIRLLISDKFCTFYSILRRYA